MFVRLKLWTISLFSALLLFEYLTIESMGIEHIYHSLLQVEVGSDAAANSVYPIHL